MSEIRWPTRYLPGTTDFYVSNEMIAQGIGASETWPFLNDTALWPTVYPAIERVMFHDGGPELRLGCRFEFVIGGTLVQAEVNEWVGPGNGVAGRIGWQGWVQAGDHKLIDAHCAWLIEDLPQDRVRVVWQESLLGPIAKELADARPNPVIAAHQEWVDGVVRSAMRARSGTPPSHSVTL